MKLRITVILLALTGFAPGATVTLSSVGQNYNGSDDYGILQMNGTPMSPGQGSASVGYFWMLSDEQVQELVTTGTQESYDTLFSSFVSIASDNFTGINAAYGPNQGFFHMSTSNYNASGLNNTLYAHFTHNSEHALFRSNLTLVPDPEPPVQERIYQVNLKDGTPLIGNYGPTYQVSYNGIGPGPMVVQSFKFSPLTVPEPSSAVMSVAGTLVFLRRNRK